MGYKKYKLALITRVLILFFSLVGLAVSIAMLNFKQIFWFNIIIILAFTILAIYSFFSLYKFISKRFQEIDDFFESVKYRDFSRWFNETSGTDDIKELHKGFNNINKTVLEINREKETQHLYLKTILELIQTGIIAYNIKSGNILWVNDAFKKQLNIPTLKNIQFIESRTPKLYETIFFKKHGTNDTISLEINNEKTQHLIANSIFEIENDSFKLIVLQNIDDTLNKSESDAWKKLLSVMTHEIMNSIAPISSLAETLQSKVELSIENSKEYPLDVTDLDIGLESIRKRSQGLLKFAKTYRSLNKVTNLNLSQILVKNLFGTIKALMLPSLQEKNIELTFETENPSLKIEIDTYLIEQVLINIILNAVEACKNISNPKITLKAQTTLSGKSVLKITDNGKGIPNEIMDNIFVPFFTTKKTGSGIGLSLCKQIMLLHKGKIIIKSIEEKGTSVSLVF